VHPWRDALRQLMCVSIGECLKCMWCVCVCVLKRLGVPEKGEGRPLATHVRVDWRVPGCS
jgi:hypothetical protein